jgi:hypothetical protein
MIDGRILECWILECWMLDAGCWMLDAGDTGTKYPASSIEPYSDFKILTGLTNAVLIA